MVKVFILYKNIFFDIDEFSHNIEPSEQGRNKRL